MPVRATTDGLKQERGINLKAGSEFFRVNQHGINGPQLLLNLAFRHLFAPMTLTIAFELIHFALCLLQNSPKTFFINDLPLVDTFQFVEHLIFE